MHDLFFDLIRVAIGTQETLSRTPSAQEWQQQYDMANKQSLLGICFASVQKISTNDKSLTINLPKALYFSWMGVAARIQQRNELMNDYTQKALGLFRKEGFSCTNLKGQGIAALYKVYGSKFKVYRKDEGEQSSLTTNQKQSLNSKPSTINLQGLRQSGDIDLWILGGRKPLYKFSLKTFGKLEGLTYHHIHFPAYEDVEIEAHSWPSFLSSPRRNRNFHKFCKLYETNEDTPSLAFNRVYILQHCFQHFTRRGVGMRQLLDYYFVLIKSYENDDTNGNYKAESMKWIKRLGMKRFAHATMWMMKEVFGLDERYLLCEINEKYGRFLLDEVLMTGNMGHGDERVDHKQLQSAWGRYKFNLKRDFRIIKICPHESLWEPLWGLYQFVWCKRTASKYKQHK